ncbi:MAG: MipA/OmpV family protein, partial [Rubrivivax sp.]
MRLAPCATVYALLLCGAGAAVAEAPAALEGAIGPIVSYAPAYQGSDSSRVKLLPGLFLRYGRLTVTNASGFVTRRSDAVVRGLGLDLSRSDSAVRFGLQLRFDRGRQEDTAEALKGLGDVKATVRLRLG